MTSLAWKNGSTGQGEFWLVDGGTVGPDGAVQYGGD